MKVAALLVSHGGARWLPAVLRGLAAQTRPVDEVVAVDTGSKDESPALLQAQLGADRVVRASRSTGFGQAVALGLARLEDEPDWVWLLHDDANPEPDALAALLAAAEADPSADILGPKLREWPSLRRLLEVGLTMSGTGRRETGLERGEYDQGQHDDVRQVLAVNTAGMLVRRDVLERLGGFDEQLPIFGNDVDFGWRAATAGHRTIVVPGAVVFHAEAAHRGLRRTPLTGRHTHYQERRAALFTQLANCSGRSLPFQVVRLALGSLLRVVGFLLVRSVGEAADELAALGSLYVRPGTLLAARRRRAALRTADPADVRALLAPRWLPYRRGLDNVSDFLSAATLQAQDVAERRRIARAEVDGVPLAPAPGQSDDDTDLLPDQGLVARLLTSPIALGAVLFVVASLIAAREAFGGLDGGALSPAPDNVMDLWRLHAESRHPLGQGTDVAAPAYVAVVALLGTLLGGSATLAVSVLMWFAVPLAAWGAWRVSGVAARLLGARGAPAWVQAWGAATYAVVPATSGAWGDGRLGTVVAAAVLPWLVHASLGFADPDADRRWRAAWRTGLLLVLMTAFAPTAWWLALAAALAFVALGLVIGGRAFRRRQVLGPPLTALGVPLLLLVPWWLPHLLTQPSGLLLDTGRPPAPDLGGLSLLTATMSAYAAPSWWSLIVLVLAVLALVPERTRLPVIACWLVIVTSVAVAAGLSRVDVAGTAPGLGVVVVVVLGAAVTAVVLAAAGLVPRLPQRLVGIGAVVLLVLPGLGLVRFLTGDHAYGETGPDPVPAYMQQSSLLGPAHGVLLLDGTVEDGLTYQVRRGDGLTLGEDEVVALTPEDPGFRAVVRSLVSIPGPAVVGQLADRGIEYVVLSGPADGRVAATLDVATGLEQASTQDRSARAWHVTGDLAADGVESTSSPLRTLLLLLQAVALIVVLVLCGPSRGERR